MEIYLSWLFVFSHDPSSSPCLFPCFSLFLSFSSLTYTLSLSLSPFLFPSPVSPTLAAYKLQRLETAAVISSHLKSSVHSFTLHQTIDFHRLTSPSSCRSRSASCLPGSGERIHRSDPALSAASLLRFSFSPA